MSIYGIGTDIIEVQRIQKAIESSSSFLTKVFTEAEIAYCSSKGNATQSYAARFAVKEAFLKALGTGWLDGIQWTDISVHNNELGAPLLIITNKAKEICDSLQIKQSHVSLSHLKDLAIAYVILEI